LWDIPQESIHSVALANGLWETFVIVELVEKSNCLLKQMTALLRKALLLIAQDNGNIIKINI
jgi:hypothetical protein